MDLIESVGPALGIVAFVGLMVLVFLLFQQAREIRRLREWAGRAPERAREAADASLAAAEARGDAESTEEPRERVPFRERVGRWLGAARARATSAGRSLPVDGRFLLAGIAVAVLAAAVLTSGFGLVGGESSNGGRQGGSGAAENVTVAVLNATQTASGPGVPGLAGKIESQVIKPAGYEPGHTDDASASSSQSVVMYAPGHSADAKALATAIKSKLGEISTQPMTEDTKQRSDGAPLALVIGLDHAEFGAGG